MFGGFVPTLQTLSRDRTSISVYGNFLSVFFTPNPKPHTPLQPQEP